MAISENSSIFAQIYTNDIIIYLLTINGIYMKKIFTLVLALMGFAGVANAATVDDIAVCKHSYVLCFDDWDNNGGAKPGKGQLFGNGFFLDVTGGSVATNKGKVNLSVVNDADDNHVTQYIADKYGADYPDDHFNSWRLKNAQDVIAMKVTAKSKLIFFLQGNDKSGKDARIPKISKNADLSDPLNDAPDENHPTTDAGFRFEWTAPDDMLIYIGTYNGDTFFSYLIVEANEAPGTPTVKVGDQKYEGGLWFREVTCKANDMVEEGSTEKIPTVVTYTTDGSAPTAASTLYTEPIKCYKDMTIKFQAFMNFGDGNPSHDVICGGADNYANVNFKFDAPSIAVDGANVTITTPYAGQGGTNFYTLNGGSAVQGDAATLTESATVVAYTEIANGEYGKFTSSSTSKDAYVLNAIKEKKTIAITSADVVVDEEATATSTDGSTVYKVENGAISADKMDFFVKNLTFNVLKDAKAQYQVPAGQEAYIQMSNTNIVFKVAAGDKVKVKVVCSKNSCKNLDADDAAEDKLDNGCTPDRQCYVNVSGTNYCLTDAEGNHTNDLKLYPDANVFEFELAGGKNVTTKDDEGNETTTFEAADTYYTFQKYSGTGNILISSIEITPEATFESELWTVAGGSKLMGSNWDTADTSNDMKTTDGVNYTLVKENVVLEKGVTYEFKVAKDHAWTEAYPSSNATLTVEETATYKVTFTFNIETKEVSAKAEKTGEAVVGEKTYSVIGTVNGNWDNDSDMTKNTDGTYSVTITGVKAGTYEFKVRIDHDWSEAYPGSNYKFTAEADGDYVITFNPETKAIAVSSTTGINSIQNYKASDSRWTLNGQQIDNNYKGVVITKGK